MKIKLLEVFAGLGSIREAAEKLEMDVRSTDIIDGENIDVPGDIMALNVKRWVRWDPDIIWGSPICTGFSVAAMGKNWDKVDGEFQAVSSSAAQSMMLSLRMVEIIKACLKRRRKEGRPDPVWWIENPRGVLRHMYFLKEFIRGEGAYRHTVTYCQYGDIRMKTTDIWTNCELWKPRPTCSPGADCHEAAPRGSQTGGTQGIKDVRLRSKIPAELCDEVMAVSQIKVEAGPEIESEDLRISEEEENVGQMELF